MSSFFGYDSREPLEKTKKVESNKGFPENVPRISFSCFNVSKFHPQNSWHRGALCLPVGLAAHEDLRLIDEMRVILWFSERNPTKTGM